MRVLVLLVALTGGCDVLWGVPAAKPMDAIIDAPLADAAPDTETCFTYEQSVDADVILFASTPSMGQGTAAVMNVSEPVKSQGLFRYGAPALAPGQRITAVTFVGPYVQNSHTCGALCTSCFNLTKDGRFDVEYATSNWDAIAACFATPSDSTTWQVAGALGATDRSASMGSAAYTKAQDLEISLDPTQAAPWIQNGTLSIIVTPSLGAATILPQKDFAVDDGACNATQPGTKLRFTVCQ